MVCNIPIIVSFQRTLDSLKTRIIDEVIYRELSLTQYRERIDKFWHESIESFRRNQLSQTELARQELETYIQKFNNLYTNVSEELQLQRDSLKDWNIQANFIRPEQIDRSLEDFRKFYNETIFTNFASIVQERQVLQPHELMLKDFQTKGVDSSKQARKLYSIFKGSLFDSWWPMKTQTKGLYHDEMNQLNKQLKMNWDTLVKLSLDGRKNAEVAVKNSMNELLQLQDEIAAKAKLLEHSTKEIFPKASNKNDLRLRRGALESQLKKLEKEGNLWLEQRRQILDQSLKSLQERVKLSESMYDEVMGKRRASMHFSIMNDITLNKVLNMIDPNDNDWTLIKTEDGISVYRKFLGIGSIGSRYACVKCTGTVKAPPLKVFELFEDNTRVKEYNTLFEDGKDLEMVAENTKIVWASSTPVFPFKARDFCTVVHTRKLKDGTLVVLNRAIKHKEAPPSQKYVRGSIILGANIIQPVQGHPHMAKLTMITQVDPGGFAPPMIVNKVISWHEMFIYVDPCFK